MLQEYSRLDADMRGDSKSAVVRVESLRCFGEVVRELGGDPISFLTDVHIDPVALEKPDAVISYRQLIHLLEHAAVSLNRVDFGLLLASRQGGMAVLGPLEIAMANSTTVGAAFRYCTSHLQAYSPVVQTQMLVHEATGRDYMRFEILLKRVPCHRQATEHAWALTQQACVTLSNGAARAREVWFTHEPLGPLALYRRYFGAPVRFNKPVNALFFNSKDLALPIVNRNPRLYDLATTFIDTRYPARARTLAVQVRAITARLLALGRCNYSEVASTLGMHPRTLQRCLRVEGESFEQIKDDVRQDAAIRYLQETSIPLSRVAAMLGYSEPSVLTRSCYRWFAHSPRQVRRKLSGETANTEADWVPALRSA
jgi:AraC-like DNA-binding protein